MTTPPKNLPLFAESVRSSESDPFHYEGLAQQAGYTLVAGVDEAGRGPLAGPVVAAAVVLSPESTLSGIQDSKKMTAKAREAAFPVILEKARAVGIGVVSPTYIDECNILRAALEAMRRAVSALDPGPDYLLVDGIHQVPFPLPQRCLKKGDRISRTISAASVLAKVYRDRIMGCYDRDYPVYGFGRNKGYGTAFHLEALKRHGPCPLHRLTFRGVS